MKQAIAGVTPSNIDEVTVMEVWPSVARYRAGMWLGRRFEWEGGVHVLTWGNLIALASIPAALGLYFFRLAPSVLGSPVHGSFYRLTNRRVVELRNEIKIGTGSRWLRIAGGLGGLAVGIVLFGVKTLFFGWAWPAGVLDWIISAIAAFHVVAGAVPLVTEALGISLPVPEFRFGVEMKSVKLDRFDTIETEQQPGQRWYDAADLVFKQDGVETFRLAGVSRPEAFRQTCLKSHMSYVGVQQALEREAVPA